MRQPVPRLVQVRLGFRSDKSGNTIFPKPEDHMPARPEAQDPMTMPPQKQKLPGFAGNFDESNFCEPVVREPLPGFGRVTILVNSDIDDLSPRASGMHVSHKYF